MSVNFSSSPWRWETDGFESEVANLASQVSSEFPAWKRQDAIRQAHGCPQAPVLPVQLAG